MREPPRALGDREGFTQRCLIQTNDELPGLAPQSEIERAVAPGELLLAKQPRLDFEPLQTRGIAKAELKVSAIDAPHLPMPVRLAMDADAAAKPVKKGRN